MGFFTVLLLQDINIIKFVVYETNMRKLKLNIFTLAALITIVSLVGWLSTYYMLRFSLNEIYVQQLSSGKREAREVAKLLEARIADGVNKDIIISDLQSTIENTDYHISFICMFNTEGIELCHPNPAKIGKQIKADNSIIKDVNRTGTQNTFLALLNSGLEGGGLRKFSNQDDFSEIVYVHPVKNTNWMLAAHTNIDMFNTNVQQLKTAVILLSVAAGAVIIILTFIVIRLIGGNYEKYIEKKNEKLQENILELSELNRDLTQQQHNLQQKLPVHQKTEPTENNEPITDARILVSWRDQLIPVQVESIAYFYTDVSGTKIICFDKQKYTVNYSLDDIYTRLNKHEYFRANRQFIISIKAIKTIYKFGNNQLKIDIKPDFEDDIIISKNKSSEFKKWLNS